MIGLISVDDVSVQLSSFLTTFACAGAVGSQRFQAVTCLKCIPGIGSAKTVAISPATDKAVESVKALIFNSRRNTRWNDEGAKQATAVARGSPTSESVNQQRMKWTER